MKDLIRDTSIFDDSNRFRAECLKFCYMNVIKCELHRAARYWNLHRIPLSLNAEPQSDRPDVLYFNLQTNNTLDFVVDVNQENLNIAKKCIAVNLKITDVYLNFVSWHN